MPQARFFVDAALAEGDETPLPPEVAHHAVRVLRLREGDPVTVFNGRGGEFSAHLSVQGARAWANLERFDPIERESPLAVTLVQAWVATDKLEWIAEKAVELGVTDITLVPTARSVVHLDGPRMERRLARLREIVVAACCQSGRNRTPAITAATSLERGLRDAVAQGARGIVLDPRAPEPLLAAANAVAAVALAIGPEGGFDDNEQALAARVGYRPACLGPRILRTETAGLAALVVLQAMAGDLRAVPGAQSDS
jgi:16S rRNA (uracil1498-N3)-methyltransferase